MRFFTIIVLLCLFTASGCKRTEKYDYIEELDHEITLKENYDKVKTDRINYLKNLLSQASSEQETANLQWDLINEYLTFQGDSAEVYSISLIELGDKTGSSEARALGQVGLMDTFTAKGYFKEANDILRMIDFERIPEEVKPFFLDLAYRLYENMESYVYDSGSGLKDVYRQKRFDYLTQLLDITHPDTYEHDAAQIEMNRLSGQSSEDIVQQREMLLKKYKTNDHNYAIQYAKMAISSLETDKKEDAREYMAKSAIFDLKASTKETTAAKNLAELMNEIGDSEHASKYIHLALDDAEFYGSQLRKVEIGTVLPAIENSSSEKNNRLNAFGVVMLAVAGFLLILSGELFDKLRKGKLELKESNSKFSQSSKELSQKNEELERLHKELNDIMAQLKETTALKDEYIMQSLSVNTGFVNSIEQKAKNIARQVREKNYEELKFVEHQLGIKEERQRIFKSFDSAFRKVFPNFIDEINGILPPEERFEISEEDDFPVDLRIFALIRLGISDPAEIAKYLNLSVKTVYVYKTRLKTKSIVDNNEFENRIMSIPKP